MLRLLIVAATYLTTASALGAVQGAHAIETIGELRWFSAPIGEVTVEQIVTSPESFHWRSLNNGDAQLTDAGREYFYRFRSPAPMTPTFTLQVPLFGVGERREPLKANLYWFGGSTVERLSPLQDRFAAFRIDAKYYAQEMLLVTTGAALPRLVKVTLHATSDLAFEKQRLRDHLAIGLIAGIVGIMILYNIATQLHFRKPYVTYHACYSVCGLYWLLYRTGIIPYSNMTNAAFYLAIWGLETAMMLFSLHILNIKQSHSRLYRPALPLVASSTACLASTFAGFGFGLSGLYLVAILTSCYCVVLALAAAQRGYQPAYAMLVGWLALFGATLLHVAGYFVSGVPDFGWAVEIAAAIEVATFTFAMGQQMHQSELSFQRENQHAFGELRKMIYPHQLERIRRGEPLESTMPTTSDRACVLSLDLIGSSAIKHINAKEFFRRFFAKCNGVMSEGYDPSELRATAYRIKEMGDGFLCSVGYPFRSITKNPANDAVVLAKRFAEVLVTESQMLHAPSPICCGIGIALDSLCGFYPEAGAVEYDLYGQALVLATRYESMRKLLPETLQGSSVLIIQEAVYVSLDPAFRLGFTAIDLQQLGLAVRDDLSATKIYVQRLVQAASDGAVQHLDVLGAA